jgi:hypothetical protein
MDKFTKLANSILKENILIQEENNDLMVWWYKVTVHLGIF